MRLRAFLAVHEVGSKEGLAIDGTEPELAIYIAYVFKLARAGEPKAVEVAQIIRAVLETEPGSKGGKR